jgi:hypothetical protein
MRAGAKARTTKQQARINRFNDLENEVNQQYKVLLLFQRAFQYKIHSYQDMTLTYLCLVQ